MSSVAITNYIQESNLDMRNISHRIVVSRYVAGNIPRRDIPGIMVYQMCVTEDADLLKEQFPYLTDEEAISKAEMGVKRMLL